MQLAHAAGSTSTRAAAIAFETGKFLESVILTVPPLDLIGGYECTPIRLMWTALGLQPHRSQTFKLSSDPVFVDKVRDIVGLYLSPPTRALVLSVDEKSQIQALDRERPVLPMMPGIPERRTPA
jgi:hypothetical protein